MKIVKTIPLVIFTVSLFIAGAGCRKPQPAPVRPPSPVTTAKAKKMNIPLTITSFGRLRAPNNVDIMAQVSGKLLAAPFTEGVEIKKGDTLFQIDPAEYQAAVDQAQGTLDAAQADLKQKKDTLARNAKLLKQKLISQEDYDQLSTAVDSAKASVKSGQGALEQANINLGYCTITSPITGVVGKRFVDPGNIVSPSSAVLVNIQSIDPLYVDFAVSEADLPEIQTANAKAPLNVLIAEQDREDSGLISGKLDFINNTIDLKTGTIALRATVANKERLLWPGEFVNVTVFTVTQKGVIVVPSSAVQFGKNGPYAYILSADKKAKYTIVKKGRPVSSALIVDSGISAGDEVIVSGQTGLYPDAPVQIKDISSADQKTNIERIMGEKRNQVVIKQMAYFKIPPDEIALFIGVPEKTIEEYLDGKKKTAASEKDQDQKAGGDSEGATDDKNAPEAKETSESKKK